jgi:subtilisin-like proprotein convertase family protein
VKEILLRSSRRFQPFDPGWRTNSAGVVHHYQFGAGVIDAEEAVRMATNWPGLGPVGELILSAGGLPKTVPDNNSNGVVLTFTFTNAGFRVEHAALTLTTSHDAWGDLAVTLTSPAGMESRLAGVHLGNPTYDYDGWTFSSVRHWGEQAEGTWTVRVADVAEVDIGTLEGLELTLSGTSPEASLAIAWSGGHARLDLRSPAVGWVYALETSEDLAAWTQLTQQRIPADGHSSLMDSTAPLSGRHFYRARLVRLAVNTP